MVVRLRPLVVAMCLFAAACDLGSDGISTFPIRTPVGRPTSSGTLVIGLVGTMSGPDAWRGEDAYEGADLAVHDLNQSLSDRDRLFRLVTVDDRGDPDNALDLVRDLSRLTSTVGIVYAGPPSAFPRAEEALAAAGVPGILVYGDLNAAGALSPHIFQMAPSTLWEARRIASYAARDRAYAKVGALVEASESGSTELLSLREAFRDYPTTVLVGARYRPGGLTAALGRLRRARTEAIVVGAAPGDFGAIVEALDSMGARYRSTPAARIRSAPKRVRSRRTRTSYWHPQVMALDLAMSPRVTAALPPGTVLAETYARGYYYLPVPSFVAFRRAFRAWWTEPAFGWQARAYDAVRMVGWAATRARPAEDIAEALEVISGERFAGLDITLGPDDHNAADTATVGLWTVPTPSEQVRGAGRLPKHMPWVPLGRGFSPGGRDLDIAEQDWPYLVRRPPPPGGPPPPYWRLRYGIGTGVRDPIH